MAINTVRINQKELFELIFCIVKSSHIELLRSKHFELREFLNEKVINKYGKYSSKKLQDLNIHKITKVFDTMIDLDNAFLQENDSRAKTPFWRKSIFSPEINCKFNFGGEGAKSKDHDISSLIASDLFLSSLESEGSYCRVCTKNVNKHRQFDFLGVDFMEMDYHYMPDCKFKLSSSLNLGFSVIIQKSSHSLDETYRLKGIIFSNPSVKSIFLTQLFSYPGGRKFIKKISSISKSLITVENEVAGWSVHLEINEGRMSPPSTSLSHISKNGYYPLILENHGTAGNRRQSFNLSRILQESLNLLSKAANPLLFLSIQSVTAPVSLNDDILFSSLMNSDPLTKDIWPIQYISISERYKQKLIQEIKGTTGEFDFTGELFKINENDLDKDNIIKFKLDQMIFWR